MPYKARPSASADDYPDQWSLIEVQMLDGATLSMNLPVSPTIHDYFISKMKETGFLALRNYQESLSIRADKVVAFKITLITTGESK